MKIVTAREMIRIEERSEKRGVSKGTLMDKAGLAVAERIRYHLGRVNGSSVLVLAGPGNNGGDGFVTARYLHDWGARVVVYVYPETQRAHVKLETLTNLDAEVFSAADDKDRAVLKEALGNAQVVVDAVLGTGSSRPIEGGLRDILLRLSKERARRTDLSIFALDLPTGLDADTGAVDSACQGADFTVTLGYPKVGLYLFPGAGITGVVEVTDIGIPSGLDEDVNLELITSAWVRGALPMRPNSAHKGTFGKVMIVAGSNRFLGAAYLASSAAGRAGAGLVTLAIPKSLQLAVVGKALEPTYLPLPESRNGEPSIEATDMIVEAIEDYDSLLVGCGLGGAETVKGMVKGLLYGEQVCPSMVIDADGLNILSRDWDPPWWERFSEAAIVTPHLGEMARLSGTTTEEVEQDRIGIAIRSAVQWNKVVVLKGAYTVVAFPDGRAVICPFANPGLASAGTGDVLAGTIAGLLAQGKSLEDAAKLGVYLHGAAGELVTDSLGEAGLLASDLLPALPQVMKELKTANRVVGKA